jgi:hypothetical protein
MVEVVVIALAGLLVTVSAYIAGVAVGKIAASREMDRDCQQVTP